MDKTLVSIGAVIGHVVKARLDVQTYMGMTTKEYEGRIVYSTHAGSLMFLPKGSRNKGYKITEDGIHFAKVIRKDKVKHEQYLHVYKNRAELEEENHKLQQELARKRREDAEEKRAREEEERNDALGLAIFEAKLLGGYEELEAEVMGYYRSVDGDKFRNEKLVLVHYLPLIQNLHKKGIPDVDAYPKHYFDKSRNPKLCALIEKKTGVKLGKTQSGNVKILNDYLKL